MPEKFLDGTDVIAVLQEVGCEAVAKCMAGDALGYLGTSGSTSDRFLYDRLMEMVPEKQTSGWINVCSSSRKHPLPDPFPAGLRRFPVKSTG